MVELVSFCQQLYMKLLNMPNFQQQKILQDKMHSMPLDIYIYSKYQDTNLYLREGYKLIGDKLFTIHVLMWHIRRINVSINRRLVAR